MRLGRQLPDPFGGRPDPQLDPVVDTGPPPIPTGDVGELLGDVEAGQSPASGQPARDGKRGKPGERADLHRLPSTHQTGQQPQQGSLPGGDLHAGPLGQQSPGFGNQIGHDRIRRRAVPADVVVQFGSERKTLVRHCQAFQERHSSVFRNATAR
jgi:hypothetical protein